MDTLTHALSGALLARATAPKAPRADQLSLRARGWAGFFAAAFPDSDFIARLVDPVSYLTIYHRGVTHSLVLLPLWALLLAALFALLTRGRYHWRMFAGVCALGIASHIVGDVITAFGTMVFAPLSTMRVALPTTFIIDPYFTALITFGLVGSFIAAKPRWPAVAGIVCLTGYIGLQGVLHGRAVDAGNAYAAARGFEHAQVKAIPQPLSPFNWMVVVEHDEVYHRTYVNLLRRERVAVPAQAGFWYRLWGSYQPVDRAHWLATSRYGDDKAETLSRAAWRAEALAGYRRFTLFPVLYRIDYNGRDQCVWFQDLRFALEGRPIPFRYGACRADDEKAWRLERLLAADHPELLDGLRRANTAAADS